ncbi:heme NO-binding domain-containing protein [uncultured Draconibacterium sp.]|uniref:heme NO-binding domain-containing protein n=1 Tax=uncultured Draconibacterium sp. TaxID=1573823 RepID=UPI0025EDEE26|nr:heme NO-binding domain-containing protein [uncultured Draconibacterium sp.]
MKGLIFKEFLEMVEKEFGYETVDSIIEQSKVPRNGVYTNVGTYDAAEMVALVVALSKTKNIPVDKLLYAFGEYAFKVFVKGYPAFFEGKTNSFELLADVENTIHVEVLKLYPDAELPTFQVEELSKDKMVMVYHSARKLGDFAEGLIHGCIKHFGEKVTIEKENIEKDGSVVRFRMVK